ncbi:MAG: hypothetical protein LQ350_003551 [Teloschistes chrysophthalmus]|nr:MAG: hypothetical protein LQ350_003551 [Niorma chrysophthalma]
MDQVLPIVQLFALLHSVRAAPSRNLTALCTDFAPPFVREPDGRGTWSLLYSCLFTLALCVWTAFHPNVKSPGASEVRKYRLKIWWIFFAIFAPELGVLTAFKQNRKVNDFVTVLSRLQAESVQNSKIRDCAPNFDSIPVHGSKEGDLERGPQAALPFSKTYGFFVLMGGLAIDVSSFHDRLKTVVLTPSGVEHLAEKGFFFDVSDEDIQDKSKANFLAKGLVLLQIAWTILQCLSRKAAGLPLSILEVHILVHAGCALIMYVLWFNKPLDIDEPILVRVPDKTLALMLVQNYRFGMPPYGNLTIPWGFQPARLSGRKFSAWPTSQASESSYLMFNPHLPSGITDEDDHTDNAHSKTSASRSGSSLRQSIASHAEQQENSLPLELPTGCGRHESETTHQDEQVKTPTITKLTSTQSLTSKIYQSIYEQNIPSTSTTQNTEHIISTTSADPSPTSPIPVTMIPDAESNICFGFGSRPRSGVKVRDTVTTGEFLAGGIGPNAYFIDEWTDDWNYGLRPQTQRPSQVMQVSDDLRSRLPMTHLDASTIAYCCPLTFALSDKDFRRWQLAGYALQEDQKAKCQSTSGQPTAFMDLNNRGSTPQGAYFVTQSELVDFNTTFADVQNDIYLRVPRNANSRAVQLRCLYDRCLEVEELKLGSTSGVMMLPGVLYGALHLSLWNNTFPSSVERLMWRISGVVLIAVPMLVAMLLAFRTLWPKTLIIKLPQALKSPNGSPARNTNKTQPTHGRSGIQMQTVGPSTPENPVSNTNNLDSPSQESAAAAIPIKDLILFEASLHSIIIIAAFYIFSRVFIIVESFISLRHVPVGVYKDVGWSKYIPHF